jgi:hypothetical protein
LPTYLLLEAEKRVVTLETPKRLVLKERRVACEQRFERDILILSTPQCCDLKNL